MAEAPSTRWANRYPPDCVTTCEGVAYVPLCERCDAGDDACEACQSCRGDGDAAFYSLRDAACVTDREYGLLGSVAFSLTFAAAGLVAGWLADKLEARPLHSAAILAWSLAGFLPVILPTFETLALARLLMGVAEGFNAPCAYPRGRAEILPVGPGFASRGGAATTRLRGIAPRVGAATPPPAENDLGLPLGRGALGPGPRGACGPGTARPAL